MVKIAEELHLVLLFLFIHNDGILVFKLLDELNILYIAYINVLLLQKSAFLELIGHLWNVANGRCVEHSPPHHSAGSMTYVIRELLDDMVCAIERKHRHV